jgi:hypothetical protein
VTLLDVPAAVDADRLARDEIAFDERHDGLGDLDLAAPSSQRRRALDGR